MSKIPDIYLLQGTKKNLELARAFQEDLGAHFFKHTMYDVKDSLSSILALCDMAEMKGLSKVKEHIREVTELISDVSLYHNTLAFNVQHVLQNVIRVIKGNYKDKLDIDFEVTLTETLVTGSQMHLEQALLYLFIEVIESIEAAGPDSSKGMGMKIVLSQKDRNATISIRLKDFHFVDLIRREVITFCNKSGLEVEVYKDGSDTQVSMRVPISFTEMSKGSHSLSVKLHELKAAKKASDEEKAKMLSKVKVSY